METNDIIVEMKEVLSLIEFVADPVDSTGSFLCSKY